MDEVEMEVFYQKMGEGDDICFCNDITVLLGDLTAKFGREEIYCGLMRSYTMHLNTNNNGKRLVHFAAAENMVVC
jgi:hypothetical protein